MKKLSFRVDVKKFIPRIDAKAVLLRAETVLTIPLFIVSWFVCAIGLSVRAGFLMAKAESGVKASILDQLLKPKK